MSSPAVVATAPRRDDLVRERVELPRTEPRADDLRHRSRGSADGQSGVRVSRVDARRGARGSPFVRRRARERWDAPSEGTCASRVARRHHASGPMSGPVAGSPTATSQEPPPRSTTPTVPRDSGRSETAPSQARRPSSSALTHDDRRSRRTGEEIDELVGVVRLSSWCGDDGLHQLDARGSGATREALGDVGEPVELAVADPSEAVGVVAEPEVHAIPVELPTCPLRFADAIEEANRVRADVDDRHAHGRDSLDRVGRAIRRAGRGRRGAPA